jgi:CheY-like chemotaxis protein
LVVDDSAAVRTSLRVTLEYEGYEVIEASNGKQGLGRVAEDRPDLVLLDVTMPGMSGLDVLERVHASNRCLPIVMMSAEVTPALREDALGAGAVEMFEKPFDSAVRLCTVLHRAIECARHGTPSIGPTSDSSRALRQH